MTTTIDEKGRYHIISYHIVTKSQEAFRRCMHKSIGGIDLAREAQHLTEYVRRVVDIGSGISHSLLISVVEQSTVS